MIKHAMIVKYEFERYPTHCRECPAFTEHPYQCHNERGMEAGCMLGYMRKRDMRDFYGNTRFVACDIEHNPNVVITEV